MRQLHFALMVMGLGLFGGVIPAAQAQWAVVDVGAIRQLIQQVQTMREQLTVARDHLKQAEREFGAISGNRGMERLGSGAVRNYLPADWAALEATLRKANGLYSALGAEVDALVNSNAVLPPEVVGALSPFARQELEDARRNAALWQVTTRQALAETSARFATLQQLIDAIATARDQKAILDLQARIAAEQTMLENEQTKLGVLYQAAEAEDRARSQRVREGAVSSVGSLRALPAMGLEGR